MAAEASGSSSSADSYLGSLISLTSKSEIRYEGVLFTINTEEASIGLRNVRSFGTEGRRKDGQQIPPIDKVYEYIVFRGSDIKDLQVKSSPPPAPAAQPSPIHHDPAIIQSHYGQAAASANKPTVTVTDTASANKPTVPTAPFQSNLPLYQPGNWASSAPIVQPTPPMQWQGYYGAPSNIQHQPIYLLPPQTNIPPSTLPKPILPTGYHSLPLSKSQEKDSVNSMPNQPKFVSGSMTSYNGMAEPLSVAAAGSSIQQPPLVTPGQFLQPETAQVSRSQPHQTTQKDETPIVSRSQPLQTTQKDEIVVQFPSAESLSPPAVSESVPVSTEPEPEAPLLPLPSQSNPQYNRGSSYNRYMHRGGHGRGRRSELSSSATSYSEDFDFEAMNEKFKKDEVWGHLGKSKVNEDPNEDSQYNDNIEFPQVEVQPVYKKDDFFDTLSSNTFDNGSRNGRNRFSEQNRFDNEQQGNFSRYRGGQGGRGQGYGGYQRGGYYGRGGGGYNGGRGQPHHNVYRP